MLGQTRECRGCGVEFVQERAGQRYHDPACQIRSNNAKQLVQRLELNRAYKKRRYDEARPWREFVCKGCGETVKTQERRNRLFCSRHCKNVVRSKEWAEANKERLREYRAQPHRRAASAEFSRQYYAENRETIRAMLKEQFQRTRLTVPWALLVRNAADRARKKKLAFDLTVEWAEERWTGRCELTGIEFKLGLPMSAPRMFSPTVDKIDPKGGYTQSNCRFILHGINALKGEETDENMYLLAEALLKNRPSA